MKKFLFLLAPVAVLTGCAGPAKVATSKLTFTDGVKTVSIISPKDVSFDSAEVDPKTGFIRITGYKSQVDAGAVAAATAQAQSQSQLAGDAFSAVKTLAEGYAKMQGMPVPASPSAQPAASGFTTRPK